MSRPPIQWYPGHIAKVERQLSQWVDLCDVVIEVVDARLPMATTNQRLQQRYTDKPCIIVLNKADLADEQQTEAWLKWFKQYGKDHRKAATLVVTAQSIRPNTVQHLIPKCIKLGESVQSKRAKKGLKPRAVRLLVVGMPNVGKSTLINAVVKQKRTHTGHKAGVTRQVQWVRIHPQVELLDTPGVIPPVLDTMDDVQLQDEHLTRGALLAMVSSVGDAAYDEELVANAFLRHVNQSYPNLLPNHYRLDADSELTLANIAQSRGWLISGGDMDIARAGRTVLADYRQGHLGKLTLETCPSLMGTDETTPADNTAHAS